MREIPRSDRQFFLESIDDENIRHVLAEVFGELPTRAPEAPFLVHLCVDLLRSSDFAEIEATDAELVPALQAAPRTFTDRLDRALPLHVRGFPCRCLAGERRSARE